MKKGRKACWLDCQDELHKSMTYSQFAILTPGEEEQQFEEDITSIGGNSSFALNAAVQETCAKSKVKTKKKNIDMLVKVRENPVGGCAKNSSDAQPAWWRVSIAIDSGACDSVILPEHVPDHEDHESVESWRGDNFHNSGDLRWPPYMREETVRGMVMKASHVTKPLGSVKKR